MKALTIFILVLMLGGNFCLLAQEASPIGKGSLIIGGSASFYNIKDTDNDNSSTHLSIRPSLMYFFFSSCAIGTTIEAASSSYQYGNASFFSIGPKVVYFFSARNDDIYPYLGASFELSNSSSYSGTALNLGIGISYFLVSHIALDGEFFFELENIDPDNDYSSSHTYRSFGVHFGLSAFIY